MRSIGDQWSSYQKQVLPLGASEVQINECRMAFYAGAFAMMQVFTSIGEPDVSEEAGMALIESFNQEFAEYAASLVGVMPMAVVAS